MADETKPEKTTELDELAFEIFSKRVAGNIVLHAEQLAIEAYRKAEAFLKVKKQIRSGGIKSVAPEELPGADCRAPNLRKRHPINLISRVDGDLALAARINAWLERNPTPERDPQELATRLNREFADLGWDLETISRARDILPAYVSN